MPFLVDLLLAIALTSVLRLSRSTSKQAKSRSDFVVIYVVNTVSASPTTSSVYLLFSIIATRLYANTMPVLNSRDTDKGLIIFDNTSGPSAIERANRRAIAQTWNIPQVPESAPGSIQIGIATETEGRKLDFQVATTASIQGAEKEGRSML
ncbi:hypothetical protein DICSQDRAFT_128131 [Dichomitus squalens LYAD-421 SS1]|uniref:Uncharacterized protein n=1 Tax=Dichomitus squalens (strain LYAD-421) TaxID=732165 RepID=R7SXA6_DICSQ|nr:uncharacterized protein DICSQDRAFT_128131 [Dichomitus squalens LYAD-421 SS1]EJF59617.1 hypothetical protein DICSQDRAFT_128131 [Dichomitus squalens LYAD-421 SS1]